MPMLALNTHIADGVLKASATAESELIRLPYDEITLEFKGQVKFIGHVSRIIAWHPSAITVQLQENPLAGQFGAELRRAWLRIQIGRAHV